VNGVTAYPLCWPPGWARATHRSDAKFNVGGSRGRRVELPDGLNRVYRELGMLGVPDSAVIVSTSLRVRLDGGIMRDQGWAKVDPGVAVYWGTREGVQRCMAIDRYIRLPDNLAAIAATLEAMRAIERHGGATILDRAFTGFTALPAPEQPFQVLGIRASATPQEVKDAYRRLASEHHPDRGGNEETMARLNRARDAMLGE
jgi:hypothetical protein